METKKISMQQAVIRVLTTPLGSRVMRPSFGSRLYELIDRTYDSSYRMDAVEWSVDAIEKNLPDLTIKEVSSQEGAITMRLFDRITQREEEVRIAFAA